MRICFLMIFSLHMFFLVFPTKCVGMRLFATPQQRLSPLWTLSLVSISLNNVSLLSPLQEMITNPSMNNPLLKKHTHLLFFDYEPIHKVVDMSFVSLDCTC